MILIYRAVQLKCADLETLQHKEGDSDAETADGGEPTEAVDSDASTEDGATTSRQGELRKVMKWSSFNRKGILAKAHIVEPIKCDSDRRLKHRSIGIRRS